MANEADGTGDTNDIESDDDETPPPSEDNLAAARSGFRAADDAVAHIRVLTKLINSNFYVTPSFVVKGDVFAEMSADWADLFFDILYVGVVFRLGDFFLAGLGLEPAHPG